VNLICHLCDKIPDQDPCPDECDNWLIHTIALSHMDIQVLLCPKCQDLNAKQVFKAYQKRIKDGEVSIFH